MPVNVDKNLTLKNNTLEATYNELFYKLNKAYAWTHTIETSTNNSVGIILNNSKEISLIKSYDHLPEVYTYKGQDNGSTYNVIIDGTFYQGINLTEKYSNNFKEVNANYLIDYDGNTYSVSNGNIINNGLLINHLSRTGANTFGITKDGKLYKDINNTNPTQIGTSNTWSKISSEFTDRAVAINDGKLYGGIQFYNNQYLLSTSIFNFVDCYNDDYTYHALTSDGKLYYGQLDKPDVNTLLIENIKTIFPLSSSCVSYVITNDNKLYKVSNSSVQQINNQGLEFTSIYGDHNLTYAYGIADNKLYFITSNSIELIDDSTSYIDITGASNSNQYMFIVRIGDYYSSTSVRYTTKSANVGDRLYLNEDLESTETIIQKNNYEEIVSSSFDKVYTRNASLDKSFNNIPYETINETVSTVDFLSITKPED